jgi:glucose dehydrogenase
VPEAVIGLALLAIGQHIVGLGGLLELLVRLGIVRVAVRVILHRDPAIGLLDLLLVSRAFDAENFVVVAFCHNTPRSRRA